MKRFAIVLAVGVLSFVFTAGCTKKEASAPAPAPQAQPAQAQPGGPMPAMTALSGKIAETMDSGGYTYVCLENSGQKTWVAIPATVVKVGQNVTCQPGMEMRNFTSKTLKRTFPSIYFSSGIVK